MGADLTKQPSAFALRIAERCLQEYGISPQWPGTQRIVLAIDRGIEMGMEERKKEERDGR
jgi:hypothetical protein